MELAYSSTLPYAPAEATPPAAATHATHCLNCEVALTGPYCAQCGQSAGTHRITMGHLLHDIPHTIWHVDKGLFFTLRELLLRPGAVVLGYLRGQRVRYFAPLSLLLLVLGISGLLAVKLHTGELAQNLNATRSSELQQVQLKTTNMLLDYMKWFYVVLAPLAGWVVRRTLRRAHLNWAEAIVAVLYVTTGSTLLTILPMPLLYWFRSPEAYGRLTLLVALLTFGYQGWAYGQLLLDTTLNRFGRWWRGLFAAITTYLLIIFSTLAFSFAVHWPAWKSAFHHEAERQRALHPRPSAHAPRP